MPRLGFHDNIKNIDSDMLLQFHKNTFTTDKCLLVASGVEDHKEYVDLAKEYLSDILHQTPNKVRESSTYIGGYHHQIHE